MEFGFYSATFNPLPSSRRHLSYDDCLEDKRENYQNCSVLCSVRAQLYTRTHEQFVQVTVAFGLSCSF